MKKTSEYARANLWVAIVAGGLLGLGLTLAGCESKAKKPESTKPVFFPEAPDKPRLQFLTSFRSAGDLGKEGPSAFERFIVGEEQKVEAISQPYGIAIHDGKIYVCDVGKRAVVVLDIVNKTFTPMTADRRLMNPVNIFIEKDGTKYVADTTAGAVFVFDASDQLQAILGRELKINPIDVATYGPLCYVTDFMSNQVVVFYKDTGKLIARLGSVGDKRGEFALISDLALDAQANIYVTDKAKGYIVNFTRAGKLGRVIGRLGDNIDEFVRPKGIAVDRANRIWVIDTGPEVGKVYDSTGRLLMYFGLPGVLPGTMNLPTKIIIDYDNIELFRKYAVEGAKIECLVLVANQYGPHKVSVYGFGEFSR